MRKFNIETVNIASAQNVQSLGANAIIFTNLSNATIYVGGVPIPAFAVGMQEYPSLVYYGLEGESLQSSFNVTFGTSTVLNCAVTRKFYI